MSEAAETGRTPRAPLDELLRDRLVEARWAELRLLSRFSPRVIAAVVAEELELERVAAESDLEPIEPWPSLPDSLRQTYERNPNRTRIARTLQFIGRGERILDIGMGYGYLGATLMRHRSPSYYCGVDISARCLEVAREGLARFAGPETEQRLQLLDIYALDRSFIDEHRPELVLLLEVMEHLPDPAGALELLATHLDERAAIVFTVPIPGRLEGVWGHLSLFDEARIKRICAAAGVTIQYVEPLQNTWMLVVASPSETVLPRVTAALAEPRPGVAAARTLTGWSIESIDLTAAAIETVGRAEIKAGPGIHFEVAAGTEGGIALPARGHELVKLEISYDGPGALQAVVAEARDGSKLAAAWQWPMTEASRPDPERRFTHVFRGGRSVGHFRSTFDHGTAAVDRFHLLLRAGGGPVSATIHRAAFFPLGGEA